MGTPITFLPVLMMLVGAMGVGVLLLWLNHVLGRKVRTKRKLSPYESGMPLLDDSHKRISVKFFIVAMMFILFDVEAAFLFPWATIQHEGGGLAFGAAVLFIVVLMLGWLYALRKDALRWQ